MARRESSTTPDVQNLPQGDDPCTPPVPSIRAGAGFTIVELLIVIIVIAILAAITIVAYNGISQRARQSAAASAAESAAKKVLTYSTLNSEQFPTDLPTAGVNNDANTTFEYSYDNTAKTYCITATFQKVSYYVSNTVSNPIAGLCAGHTGTPPIADGAFIQSITSANCPTTRKRAVDARDNHTYWVQKLADGKCWMLTNLAYAGGGTNTYNDVMPTGDGTAGTLNGPDNAGTFTYSVSKYYIPTNANPTTEPTPPSTSTDGGATNPQYGYLYNFCAVNKGQAGNGACSSSSSAAVDTTISICPAGWRLPTGVPTTGEFTALNTAVNSGATNSDAGIRSTWLAQRGGFWDSGFSGGFSYQGSSGYYWTSSQQAAYLEYNLSFSNSTANPADNYFGRGGLGVRCVAV